MPRERLCKVCREWHNPEEWPAECMPEPRRNRSAFPLPMMNLDNMDAVQSQADGLWYDSKSALRRAYRDQGMIEVGNEPIPDKPLKAKSGDDKAAEAAAVNALKRSGVWDELSD